MSIPLSPAGVWQIDTSHTQVGFSIRHLGISTVHGLFTEYSGRATIGADLRSTNVELTAATRSVDTGNTWRDEHLVGEHFFESDRFPAITFRSVAIEAAGEAYRLLGDLTIKGITHPVTFDLEFSGTSVFPMDETLHAGFLATTTIKRTAFDVGYGVPIASDDVVLRIDAQLVAPDGSDAPIPTPSGM
ncbi:MAG: polyisoprenoid-binding protein [Ilumatobacteraceae bacterium]|nr:polyisoprenoid-binding protein [Ilumatobacteraceae bacterium]